jgi:predicted peroxiredoxin/TusA-related sulfurtransferase
MAGADTVVEPLVARSIDTRPKTITTAIAYEAHVALAPLADGDVLEVVTEDFEPIEADLQAWCGSSGQRLVTSERTAEGLRFLIEKGPTEAGDTRLAMVISTDGLEELLSPLGFALAAALEGVETHLYFQGPGVRVLSRGFKPRLRGWGRPFSRFAAAGMAKAGHVAAQEKLRQLRSLGARVYVCGPSLQHFKVSKDELVFDDLPVVAYLSFMALMQHADVHVYS